MGRQKAKKPRRVRPERPEAGPLLALYEQHPAEAFYRLWAPTSPEALDTWRSWDAKYRGHEVGDAQLRSDLEFYATVYGPEAPVHAVLQVERYIADDAVPWKDPGKAQQMIPAHGYGESPSEDRYSLHGLLAGLWADLDDEGVLCSRVDADFVDRAVAHGLAWQEPSGRWKAVPAPKRPVRT